MSHKQSHDQVRLSLATSGEYSVGIHLGVKPAGAGGYSAIKPA